MSIYAAMLVVFTGLCLSSYHSFGTHAAGAELTYKCLGGLNYEVEAIFYRDCGGTPEPGNLTISYSSSLLSYSRISIANKVLVNNGIEITMPCATSPSSCNGGVSTGLKKWMYRTIVTLPFPAADWVFSYRVCCRNCTVTTITNPCAISSELYVEAKLNNILAPGNSSPQFNGVPVSFVCLGQNFNYNSSAFDIDGDSITYELIKPKTSANTEIDWVAPASTQQPLNSSTAFHINQLTGEINFTPSAIQIGILAVKISEFRNGQLIGSIIRDMQVYTRNCVNTIPYASGIDSTNNYSASVCAGNQICFTISTFDIDSSQIVSVTSNNLPAGATLTHGAGNRPQLVFCWTPSSSDVSNYPKVFTLTVRDNACPQNGIQTFSYSILVQGNNISVSTTNPTCNNLPNGTATVSGLISQGSTFLWNTNPPQNTATATGLSTGIYSVLITDPNGCSSTSQAVIQAPNDSMVVTATGSGYITCQSGNNGTGQVNIIGGEAPFSYVWSNGSTTPMVNNLAGGIHSVTVTDAFGCSAIDTLTISQSPTSISVQVAAIQHVTCYGDSNGRVQITASGGTMPYTYLWSNGFTGFNNNNLVAGTYTVTVTDVNGCINTTSINVQQPLQPLSTIGDLKHHVSCYNGNDGSLGVTAMGGTGPYSYSWSNGAFGSQIQYLMAGVYSVTVTDIAGCTSFFMDSIHEPMDSVFVSAISIQNVKCHSDNNGHISITLAGGTAPYSYLWNNGNSSSMISGLTAGTYTLTVTDMNGCLFYATNEITEPDFPVEIEATSITHIVCGQGSGAISVSGIGGTTPFSYFWSTGATTQTIQNLNAGQYTVTVTDTAGCSRDSTFEVRLEGNTISIAADTIQHVTCFDMATGYIGINISGAMGPVTYLWSNGAATANIQNLTAGSYSVTVTDSLGCSSVNSFVITQPAAPMIAVLSDPDSLNCYGQTTATLEVHVAGGTAPFNFNWSTGATSQTINGLGAGIYSVIITDANGCMAIDSAEVVQPASSLTVSATILNHVACYNGTNGSAIVNATGGTSPYTYEWSNGTSSHLLTGVESGIYKVTVTDISGCSYSESVQISEPTASLTITNVTTHANCLSGVGGSININVNGGTAPYIYEWSNGSFVQNLVNIYEGSYSVVVTDINGCTISGNFSIENNSQLNLSAIGSTTICAGEMVSLIADSVSNGVYQWYFNGNVLNGATGNSFLTPAAGQYSVTAIGACGTVYSDTIVVEVKSMDNVSISNQQIICPPETAMLFATGGKTYSWSPSSYITFTNVPDPIVSPQSTTVYTVEIANEIGCKTTLSTTVAVLCDSLFVPTGFSPNSDGVNDGYVIDGIENYPGNKIWVYNRYGKLVFKATDYLNDWNGISNISGIFMNKKVGNGTYFYILDLNDRSKPRAGYLIIRH